MNVASRPDLPTGRATMSPAFEGMRHYQRYQFSLLAPWLGERVLEVGVGHGVLTSWLAERADVLVTDVDHDCLHAARERFSSLNNVSVAPLDLADPPSIAACGSFRPDTVICINVLEHIERHDESLRGLRETVTPSGRLLLLVPAHPTLYGRMDHEAGHFRRYTRRGLASLLADAGWHVEHSRYVNALGAIGWWVNNRVRRNAGLEDPAVNAQMKLADRGLALFSKLTDPIAGRAFGLSVFAVAAKK